MVWCLKGWKKTEGEGNKRSYNKIGELEAIRKRETAHEEKSINVRMGDLTR